MTTSELNSLFYSFEATYNGKQLQYLPSSIANHKGECFDVIAKWGSILGVPNAPGQPSAFPYVNAYQIYTDFGPFQATYFDRIANSPTFVPIKGDIVVWAKGLNGGIGHTAVATGEGDTNTFTSLDQNWYNGAPVQLVKHSYDLGPVLGVLRYKITNLQPTNTMDNRGGNLDLLWHGMVDPNADTRSVTEQQVRDVIAKYKSASNRAGQYDQVAIAAKYTQDTNQVAAQTLVNMIKAQVPQFDKQVLVDKIIAFVKTL